MDSCNHCWI